jgi:hypothetical protein
MARWRTASISARGMIGSSAEKRDLGLIPASPC